MLRGTQGPECPARGIEVPGHLNAVTRRLGQDGQFEMHPGRFEARLRTGEGFERFAKVVPRLIGAARCRRGPNARWAPPTPNP